MAFDWSTGRLERNPAEEIRPALARYVVRYVVRYRYVGTGVCASPFVYRVLLSYFHHLASACSCGRTKYRTVLYVNSKHEPKGPLIHFSTSTTYPVSAFLVLKSNLLETALRCSEMLPVSSKYFMSTRITRNCSSDEEGRSRKSGRRNGIYSGKYYKADDKL